MSLAELFQNVEETDLKQKIVEELFNTDENLESKTELAKPMKWACLNVVRDFIEDRKLPKSVKILEKFEQQSFKFLISNKRKGREEYIQALQSLNDGDLNEEKPVNNRPIQ